MTRFDPTQPVQTKSGRAVRILATDLDSAEPIVAAVESYEGGEMIQTYCANGSYRSEGPCGWDLVNVPAQAAEEQKEAA